MLVCLGFSASVSNDIYQRKGVDSIYEWASFDKDDVVFLLFLVRKPGGGINDEIVGF